MPELAKVRGDGKLLIVQTASNGSPKLQSNTEIHEPPAKLAEKLGYALPLVKHNEARERAIRRYKVPGEE